MIEGKRGREVEDEGMEVERLLAEPRNDRVSVDDFFSSDKEQDAGIRVTVDVSGGAYDDDEGGSEKVNGKVSDISRKDPAGLFSICEDYLLDAEDVPREGLSFEKSSLDTRSSGYNGSDSSAVGASESSATSMRNHGFRNGSFDKRILCKVHGVFKSKCCCQDQVKEKPRPRSPIRYTSQSRRKLQSASKLLSVGAFGPNDVAMSISNLHRTSEEASHLPSSKKSKQIIIAANGVEMSDEDEEMPLQGSTDSSKRSRKPPIRYINEYSGSASRFLDEKQSGSAALKNRVLDVRTSRHKGDVHKQFRPLKPGHIKGYYGNSHNQSMLSNKNVGGKLKEFTPVTRLDSDEETEFDEPDEPDDIPETPKRSKGSADRRKNQKSWTLPEVVKLVDGISHHGVGRWTEIQRRFFPTSTYRTPVDLRDKWRNLLKASNAWMQNGQEDDQDQEDEEDEQRKEVPRQLPKVVLQRISELGRIYPYPIQRTPKDKVNRYSQK